MPAEAKRILKGADFPRHAYAWQLLRYQISRLGWRYGAFVLAVIGFGLAGLLPAQLFYFFTDEISHGNVVTPTFLKSLAIFGTLVGTTLFLTTAGRILCKEWLRLEVEADLRRRVLHKIHEAPLVRLDGAQRGDWLTRMTTDLRETESFLTESLPEQVRQLAVLFGAGTLFLFYSGWMGLLPLISAAIIAIVNIKVQKRLAPILSQLRNMHGSVFQLLIENLEGIRTIRSQRVEPYIQRRFEEQLGEITHSSMGVVRSMGALIGTNQFLAQGMITLCLTAGAWGLHQGTLTLGELLFYPFYIGLFYTSAQGLAAATYDWNRFLTEGGRLGELLYERETSIHRPEVSGDMNQIQSIAMKKMEFGYQTPLIGPLTFELKKGELTAIMGPSGCGKSTFLEIVAGLRPTLSGDITVHAPYHPVWHSGSENSLQLPLGICSYVEQTPYIFEGTLRENLVFGNAQRLSDMVLWDYLERVALFEFARKRGGLDLQLNDRGKNLSEGERFRIALCRALLLKRPFLLLDEPFASLDEQSVSIVVNTLKEQSKEQGILLVTHYLPRNFKPDTTLDFGIRRKENRLRASSPPFSRTANSPVDPPPQTLS